MKLILASKSPRRSELLKKINVNFKVVDSEVDETTLSEKIPERYCQKLASLKAKSVLKKFPEYTIIGADTIVEIEKEILEKPSSFSDAYSMLEKLSGKKHNVLTGISIISNKYEVNFVEKTIVSFFKLRKKDIENYILKNHPYDKSGSYGIQDDSMIFVESINGNYENVIGMPIAKVYQYLSKLKVI